MKQEDYADLFTRKDIMAVVESKAHYGIGLLWLAQRGRCFWCNITCLKPCKETRRLLVNRPFPPDFFTLDHVQSRWQGGGSGADNVVGSCYRCNSFRNSTEHKREVGRAVALNQPEEVRLKRFLPIDGITIPFEKGRTRQEHKKFRKHLALSV